MTRPVVLVIEDSPTVRRVVELTFQSTNFTLDFSATGTDGAARAASKRPDLVLVDYVLPDMKAIDVCGMLAKDARTRDVPVILMSGSLQKVRHLFHDLTNVVDFVAKPFTPGDLIARVESALTQRSAASERPTSRTPIPAMASHASLRPTPSSAVESSRPALSQASSFSSAHPSAALEGSLARWSMDELSRLVSMCGDRGELRVEFARQTVVLYCRQGEICFVTCLDPNFYLQGASLDERTKDRTRIESAEFEHRASGKPVFVTLAEMGAIAKQGLAELLAAQGKKILFASTDAPTARFSWRDRTSFPYWVDAYDIHLFPEQLRIEKLRVDRPVDRAEQALSRAVGMLDRKEGFSRRLRRVVLTPEERLTLAHVDGRSSVPDIIRRTTLPRSEATLILHRLLDADLVAFRESTSRMRCAESRTVLLLESDVEEFQRPFVDLLATRPDPYELVVLHDADEVLQASLRARPRLVVVNVSGASAKWATIARAVRDQDGLAGIGLLGIQEAPFEPVANELARAGFDAVLAKPINCSEIERWLDG